MDRGPGPGELTGGRHAGANATTSMQDPDFPEDLCAFIQHCTPSIEAVEALLAMARAPGRAWTPGELARKLAPTILSESALREYLQAFVSCHVVERQGDGRYAYSQPPVAGAALIAALEKAYNERPVSLVRLIYALKEQKIRSFADAFKLRKG
jgi:hypothetical protein